MPLRAQHVEPGGILSQIRGLRSKCRRLLSLETRIGLLSGGTNAKESRIKSRMARRRNLRRRRTLWVFGLVLAIPGNAAAQDLGTHVAGMTGNASTGKKLYHRYCIGCHGPRGDGEGENAPYVVGPLHGALPRNFTLGLFKCRSTPTGSLPLDSDLYDTISRGIYTTFMPPWRSLTPQQRVDLVAYVKTFSLRFKEEKPDDPIKIPPATSDTPESRKRGEELYQNRLKCVECHGASGHSDGPSSSTLRDDLGNPIRAFDFATGTRFKCGSSDEDLVRIFMTGLDGTPMPSWADYLNGDQTWDLVHYLRSLMVNYHREGTPVKAKTGK